MGIGDLRKVVSSLTPLPVVVLNSHTHNDHVGDNWQFDTIYGVDTDFTRRDAAGQAVDGGRIRAARGQSDGGDADGGEAVEHVFAAGTVAPPPRIELRTPRSSSGPRARV